jgi:hypothetical protein
MHHRELLVERLMYLIEAIEHGASDTEISERFRGDAVIRPLFAPELERRLGSLERKIDALLERPQRACRLASPEGENVLELMTGVGAAARAEAITYLGGTLKGAKHLTICDPYFRLAYWAPPKVEYVSQIDAVLPTSVNSIELFVKPYVRDSEVALEFTKLCRARGIRLTCRTTQAIHDRVWIADWSRAFVVGTSSTVWAISARSSWSFRSKTDDALSKS